jgi:hypothetical protein
MTPFKSASTPSERLTGLSTAALTRRALRRCFAVLSCGRDKFHLGLYSIPMDLWEGRLHEKVYHQKKESYFGATGQGGVKPFVDYLKYKLHLPYVLKEFGDKLWGYKLSSLVLVLICRLQLSAGSIAALREKLLCRFISRLFYFNAKQKLPQRKLDGKPVSIFCMTYSPSWTPNGLESQ